MKASHLLSLLALVFFACSMDSSNPVNNPIAQLTVSDFFPMTVGSYWVYQVYDSASVPSSSWGTDSVVAEKDTIMRGSTYTKMTSSMWGATFWRDSAGYLVSHEGKKYFTINNDFSALVSEYVADTDSAFHISLAMKESDTVCVVPAGTFLARKVVGTLIALKQSPELPAVRSFYRAYANRIGIVSRRSVFVLSDHYLEARLVRYHLVPGVTP